MPKRSRRKRGEGVNQETTAQTETTVPDTTMPETTAQEETVQDQFDEETDIQHPEQEIDPGFTEDDNQVAQGIITETLSELAQEIAQKRKEGRKKRKQDKGKSVVQETHLTPENTSEEDTQPLAQRMAKLHKTALSKKEEKQKQKVPKEKQSTTSVRRSSRLQNRKVGATKGKQSFFIDLSTPQKGATSPDLEKIPSHAEYLETSPPREESQFEHEPQFEQGSEFQYEHSPKRSLEVDPDQQKVYNYLETLEQAVAGPSTAQPLEQQVQSLKQEIFELEVLNRHIKQENERLKEQSNVDKMVQDNTMLHMGLWQKENKKLKKRCRKLNRALINLKFRCLMKRPRINVATQRKKRRLDVLSEASQQVD